MFAAFFEDLAHQRFFTNVAVAKVLNAQPSLFGQALSILSNLIPQRLGPASVVEDADAFEPQMAAHPIGITDARYGAADHDPVQAGQLTEDFVGVSLSKSSIIGLPLWVWPLYIKPR